LTQGSSREYAVVGVKSCALSIYFAVNGKSTTKAISFAIS